MFASELKTLVLTPAVGRAIDKNALNIYLALGYIPSPYCLIAGVRKADPGPSPGPEDGVMQEQPFWDPTLASNGSRPLAELVSETRSLLQNAVSRQLMGDVPLGVLLSGGLDSTLIAALACRSMLAPSIPSPSVSARLILAWTGFYNADFVHARLARPSAGEHPPRDHHCPITRPI